MGVCFYISMGTGTLQRFPPDILGAVYGRSRDVPRTSELPRSKRDESIVQLVSTSMWLSKDLRGRV